MKQVSKRVKANKDLIEAGKTYSVTEAVALAQKTANTKFGGSIEVHIRTNIDPKKTDQAIRGAVTLPHGTGKTKRIAAFVTDANEKVAKDLGAAVVGGEELIKSIKETEKTDFDIAVAEPALMPKLAVIAKILGTRGLMPNPKTGTVSENISAMIKEIAGGRVTFKNDETGNIHQAVGKSSFTESQIAENITTFIEAVQASRPAAFKGQFFAGITLNATMGPGIKIKM